MNQSFAFLLSKVKTNQSCICARVPQSSSLPQSCAEEKSSGVEIGKRLKKYLRNSSPKTITNDISTIFIAFPRCLATLQGKFKKQIMNETQIYYLHVEFLLKILK